MNNSKTPLSESVSAQPAAMTSSQRSEPGFNLADHFLIAMPSIQDPVFGGAVVYVCEHNDNGVLGVIINKPTDMTLKALFERIDVSVVAALPGVDASGVDAPGADVPGADVPGADAPVMFGGPVQDDRGFVLHSPGTPYSSSLKVNDEIAFTTSIDVLQAVATGDGPQRMLVSIGYSGWSPGQLENEIGRNGWLTVAADAAIVFDVPVEQRYVAAMKLLGIDPLMLASEAGHA